MKTSKHVGFPYDPASFCWVWKARNLKDFDYTFTKYEFVCTEDEAHARARKHLDGLLPPGTESTYYVCKAMNERLDLWPECCDDYDEIIVSALEEFLREIGGDHQPDKPLIVLSKKKRKELNVLVQDFMFKNKPFKGEEAFEIDPYYEQKHTYVSGSQTAGVT